MSELKKIYVEKNGHDYENIKKSSWYLAKLSLRGAIELDNHILGRNNDFEHLQEFADILKDYQLNDADNSLIMHQFPYIPLWKAMKKGSTKEIKQYSELALEMRLLRYELSDMTASPEKLKKVRSLLCDISEQFSSDCQIYNGCYLIA